MNTKDLSELEIKWLRTRGGRSAGDVYKDDTGMFVIMVNKNGDDVKEYIPTKRRLNKMFNYKKDGTKRKRILC
jgi:hypothetical protein